MEKTKKVHLVRQPNRLENLAILKLGNWIAFQAKKLISPEQHANRLVQLTRLFVRENNLKKVEDTASHFIENVRNLFQHNVPKTIHNELTNILVKFLIGLSNKNKTSFWSAENNKNDLIWRMLETLYTENLTNLIINLEFIRVSLCNKSFMLTGLTRLELYPTEKFLKNRTYSATDETKVIEMLKGLPRLKSLVLEDICSDNVLKCITENCVLIEDLSLRYSKAINDKSIDLLTLLPNLKSIDLHTTNVSQIGIQKLLLSHENIEDIFYDRKNAVNALEQIALLENCKGKVFQLKSGFISDNDYMTFKRLQILIAMCPGIQVIFLMKDVDDTPEDYLLALIDLQDLQILELQGYDFYADQINKVLEVKGNSLKHLHLVNIQQIDMNALICINQMCPNLECLYIRDCSFVKESLNSNGFVYSEFSAHVIPFRNLDTLALAVSPKACQSRPTDDQLLFLLSNCPNVKFMNIGETPIITDEIISEVLSRKSLAYLNKLVICNNVLSKLVIEQIILNCCGPIEILNFITDYKHPEDGLATNDIS